MRGFVLTPYPPLQDRSRADVSHDARGGGPRRGGADHRYPARFYSTSVFIALTKMDMRQQTVFVFRRC